MDPPPPQMEAIRPHKLRPSSNEVEPPHLVPFLKSRQSISLVTELIELPTHFERSRKLSLDSTAPLVLSGLCRLPHNNSTSLDFLHNTGISHVRYQQPSSLRSNSRLPSFQAHGKYASDSYINYSEQDIIIPNTNLRRAPMMSASPIRPNLNLPLDPPQRKLSVSSLDESYDSSASKSKGNRFTSFFRWQSGSSHEPTTPVSARAPSPSLSPKTLGTSFKSLPPMIDTLRANAVQNDAYLSDSGLSLPPLTPGMGSYDSIEEELRIVSAELAASIKREMELEDLVEKLESDIATANGNNREKRTSDYFSDAGTPVRDLDVPSNIEQELEKMKRHYEQEKAQIRLEMLGKLSDERQRRMEVETQMRELEDQVSRGEYSQLVSTDAGKVAKLAAALEDAKRKLAEERQARENFESLVTAIKGELEEYRDERDRLKDDVVPKLRARVIGLEAETSQMQQILNDKARLQQELVTLRLENMALLSSRNSADVRLTAPAGKRMSLAQMTGLTTALATTGLSPIPSGAVSPLSPKEKETLADKLKDVEAQRDELHRALKSLRERQKYESRQAKLKIKALEAERDRALRDSPRKFANSREIALLRREVDRLRQRAEEALEAKFICERNLGSLKMDLERAEQETATLRILLHEHDSLVNQHEELKESHFRLTKQMAELKYDQSEAQSASLQRAYRDLQHTHELTLSRLDDLESRGHELSDDFEERQKKLIAAHEESEKAMNKLRQSLAEAEARRDTAQLESEAYKKRADALQAAEKAHIKEERALESQLRESTERVSELAAQVQMQMQSNGALRERLAAAIERGETEQQASASRINDLQSRLKTLEEKVLLAQQETEDTIARHEEEIRMMQENHTAQLTRLRSTLLKSPNPQSPRMPLSPLLKSPRLEWASMVGGSHETTANSTERVNFLEKRVLDLEKALAEADKEMEEVVGRMSLAQIEVMELTSQRDEAARLTRKLQADIAYEKQKFAELLGA